MATVVATNIANNFQFRSVYSQIRAVKLTTADIASLADGVGANEDVTITGLALYDQVIGISLGVSTAGITVTGDVTAANTLRIRFQNESGGTLDLASTTVYVTIGTPNLAVFT